MTASSKHRQLGRGRVAASRRADQLGVGRSGSFAQLAFVVGPPADPTSAVPSRRIRGPIGERRQWSKGRDRASRNAKPHCKYSSRGKKWGISVGTRHWARTAARSETFRCPNDVLSVVGRVRAGRSGPPTALRDSPHPINPPPADPVASSPSPALRYPLLARLARRNGAGAAPAYVPGPDSGWLQGPPSTDFTRRLVPPPGAGGRPRSSRPAPAGLVRLATGHERFTCRDPRDGPTAAAPGIALRRGPDLQSPTSAGSWIPKRPRPRQSARGLGRRCSGTSWPTIGVKCPAGVGRNLIADSPPRAPSWGRNRGARHG